jgi:hypothetical protein
MTRFYVGTHHPHWLWTVDFPVFVSHRRLCGRSLALLRPARVAWALDSGGFTELSMYGGWRTTPEDYAEAVRGYLDRIGRPDFVAPQDWMCEPVMLARTGLSVREHQHRTVANFLRLRELAPEVPFAPVVQGWRLPDYEDCLTLYQRAGVDLAAAPVVGLGSVCRRQSTTEIATLVTALSGYGLRLHGFGVKTGGLARYGPLLASADSMAWSFRARRSAPLLDCTTHRNCANCPRYAARWRTQVLARLAAAGARGTQTVLLDHTGRVPREVA